MWAEHNLDNPSAEAEIAILREFYEAWESLHNVPQGYSHRRRAEQAAEKLVDMAQTVAALREPSVEIRRILNG